MVSNPRLGAKPLRLLSSLISSRVMSDKLKRLQAALGEHDLDLLVLNPGPTMFYLTDHAFTSHERLFLLLLPRVGDAVAVVPLLEEGNWRHAVPSVARVFPWDDADGPEAAAKQAFAALSGAHRVGIEPLALRYMEYSYLARMLPKSEVVSAEAAVSSLRLRKSQAEAEAIRVAARIAEAALDEVLRGVKVGSREDEIASHLASELLRRGGGAISFGPIVLGGPKSALPHGVPDERRLRAGELLLIDFGTSHRGYHCDITRCFVVGAEPDERTRSVYQAVLDANRAGCAASRPGVTAGDVHQVCQAGFEDPKWQAYMKHRTGHGLGIDIHEPPSIMRGNDQRLEAGMVFTVEPGLYLEGWGGVRIEDDLWLTADGSESLTSYPRELRVIAGPGPDIAGRKSEIGA